MAPIRLHLFGALFLASATAALAQDAVRLEAAHKPGERWSFEETAEQTSTIRVMTNGTLAQQMDQKQTELRKGTLEVLEVHEGEPSAVRVTYDPTSGERKEQTGQPPQDRKFSYAGETVTVRRNAGAGAGAQVQCQAQLEEEDKKKLAKLVEGNEKAFLPKHPVKPGDRWIADEKAIAAAFDLTDRDRGTLKCKLKSIVTADGRPTAAIEISLAVVKVVEEWMQIQIDMDGTGAVDLETGQLMAFDVSGPLTFSGTRDVPGQNGQTVKVEVEGTGQSVFRAKSKPLAAGPTHGPEGGVSDKGGPPPRASAEKKYTSPWEAYGAMIEALEAKDFEAFRRLHTAKAQADLTREGFDRAVARLAAKGRPPVAEWKKAGELPTEYEVSLQNGRHLTTLVNRDGAWLCDEVWTK